MVLIITGASHTGKTLLAQKILEKYKYPYLSIDHLKMGLIRSGNTSLTVYDDEKLTDYLWPIVREIIKTAIENNQNLIVEGCYVPFNWSKNFEKEYLRNIKYVCLVMSWEYIENNYNLIITHSNDIEKRLSGDFAKKDAIEQNKYYLNGCLKNNLNYYLINKEYNIEDIIKKLLVIKDKNAYIRKTKIG